MIWDFSMRQFVIAIVLCCAVALPLSAIAQEQEVDGALLRSEMRAALLADDRSSELSEEEVAMLVEALAVEAEKQGIAADFLPQAQESFPESMQGTAGTASQGWWASLSEPALYGIVLAALALAMVLMKRIHDIHHARNLAATSASTNSPPSPSSGETL